MSNQAEKTSWQAIGLMFLYLLLMIGLYATLGPSGSATAAVQHFAR